MDKPVVFIVGTRPDAIKVVPVYKKLKLSGIPTILCATNQHKELLTQVLNLLDVKPDIELHVMKDNQTLDYLSSSVLQKTTAFFKSTDPRLVVVQGDTTSSFSAALAAYYLKIPIAHIEAGLRTGNIASPFPEEINRVYIAKIANMHFAPTPLNVLSLLNEGVEYKNIYCVGNTVVDSLLDIEQKIFTDNNIIDDAIRQIVLANHNIVLLTTHRRESFDGGILEVLYAIKYCAEKYPDLFFIFPVHPNPHVQEYVSKSGIDGASNIFCCKPLKYTDLVYLLLHARLVVTDSGGIQEEAVILGKHVIILREHTERVEAVWEGVGELVGTNYDSIIAAFDAWYSADGKTGPCFVYGDGNTSQKIVDIILKYIAEAVTINDNGAYTNKSLTQQNG